MDLIPITELMAAKPLADQPNAVYRLYGCSESLLYVGATASFRARLRVHARKKPWWSEVSSGAVEWYQDREDAERAEAAVIFLGKPRYNVAVAAGAIPTNVGRCTIGPKKLRRSSPSGLSVWLPQRLPCPVFTSR